MGKVDYRLAFALVLVACSAGPAWAIAAQGADQAHAASRRLRDDAGRRALGLRHYRHRRAHGVRIHRLRMRRLYAQHAHGHADDRLAKARPTAPISRSSTWEQGDGQKFRLPVDAISERQAQRCHHGPRHAHRAGHGRRGEAQPAEPRRAQSRGQVLFPTQHSLALIGAAREGEKLLQAQIYDGSEKGRRSTTRRPSSVSRWPPERSRQLETAAKDKGLAELVSWPVSIGYFEAKGGDLTPSYQIDFRLYTNGVSRELVIDYGDFSIQGRLTSLEYLKAEVCPARRLHRPGKVAIANSSGSLWAQTGTRWCAFQHQ